MTRRVREHPEFDSRILHKKQAAEMAAFFCGEWCHIPPKSPFAKGGLGREQAPDNSGFRQTRNLCKIHILYRQTSGLPFFVENTFQRSM